MDAAFLNGEQGEDAPLVTEDERLRGGASRLKILEPSAPGKGDPFHDPEIHDPDHPAYDASPPFAMRELALFPMRHSCLATHATVVDLDAQTIRPRFFRYLRDAVPGAPELAAAVRVVARVAPRWTRVKELVESVEAFKHALAFLAEAESHRGGLVIKTCFDMACGHGLVGVLFAYAFPEKTARACDWARRPAFDAYARVFGALAACEAKGARFDYRAWECANASRIDAALEALARDKEATEETLRMKDERDAPDVRRETKDPKSSDAAFADGLLRVFDETLPGEPLGNVRFTQGDLVSLEPLVNRNAFVMALHGCNESTRDALALARRANAPWCVMPCCVVKDLYAPECVLSNLDDATRYAFLCGVLAHKYGASLVRAVDRRITNRPIMLFGGLETRAAPPAAATRVATEGVPDAQKNPAPPAGPFTLRFPMAHKRLVSRVAARRERAGKEEGGTG
jgi:hypothetical protein